MSIRNVHLSVHTGVPVIPKFEDIELLFRRFQNPFGLGLNRNPHIVDGYKAIIKKCH